MARVSRKRAAASASAVMVLPYGCAEAGAPERTIERVEVAPTPAYRTPAAPMPDTQFGRWLLEQTKRDGWIGDLAKAAKADRGFPKEGDPDAVRKRLNDLQAEGDMFEAVDDAETAWLTY